MTTATLISSPGLVDTTVAVVRDAVEWDSLAREWDELFDACPSASPPLRFDWLRHWWRIYGGQYGNRGRGLRIMTVRSGGQLIGALPLYQNDRGAPAVAARRWAFISTGEQEFEETCADYMDLLSRPGEQLRCVEALRRALADQRLATWDELLLDRMPATSPLLAWRDEFAAPLEATATLRGLCPVSDLSGGIEGYLKRLSASTRKECRRLLNEAERSGLTVECASDAATTERFFDEMVELHQRRWRSAGKPGCFAARRFEDFHRGLARQWVPEGKAVLIRMSIGDRAVSVVYGVLAGGKFNSYLQGTALDEPALRSAGTAALLLARKVAVERGMHSYDDLLGTPDAYKQRFGTERVPLMSLRIVRPGIRSSLQRASEAIVQAAQKGRRMLAAIGSDRRPARC